MYSGTGHRGAEDLTNRARGRGVNDDRGTEEAKKYVGRGNPGVRGKCSDDR